MKFMITLFAISLNIHSEISHMLHSVTAVGNIMTKSYCKDLNTTGETLINEGDYS